MMKVVLNYISVGLLLVCIFCGLMQSPGVSAEGENSQQGCARTVLVIIDIQNDYFPGGKLELLGSDAASLKAKKLLKAFRKKGLPIIHIRHENLGAKATFFLPGTAGADIHKNIAPRDGELVILKHKANSFVETNLSEELQKLGVNNLIICGMQTNVCVRATSLDALQRGFSVTVVEDALAARSVELHQTAIQEMINAQVKLIKSDALIRNLQTNR